MIGWSAWMADGQGNLGLYVSYFIFLLCRGLRRDAPEYTAIGHALNVRMLGTSLDRVVPHGWIYEWMGAEVEPNKEWLCKHHCGL